MRLAFLGMEGEHPKLPAELLPYVALLAGQTPTVQTSLPANAGGVASTGQW